MIVGCRIQGDTNGGSDHWPDKGIVFFLVLCGIFGGDVEMETPVV